ncbi:flagellar hook-associated protein FlgK [Geoalkalibacter sp.]|uniref:flagellar hook-associated protein FlgK n=1 Tax=Geoalkalibacter sp. TaxID=3041440 RepID=UPI00272E0094|nr:flagellar hook-associated protein FlgK [Geoalkalibacter sp.]
MAGLLSALNAGKTSLRTSQKAVEIAGNNIANVNTPGYSRQVAVFQPVPSLELRGFFIGQGVNINNIAREHDVFLTRQIHDKSGTLGEESARSAPMAELERIFSVAENNLSTEIDRFFDSWKELSSNPSGQTERQIVLQRGELLSRSFNEAVTNLTSAQRNINAAVESKVTGINPVLQEIADLNLRISTLEISGQTANNDRDRRDLLIEEVSRQLGVTYYEENGKVSLQLPGGLPLVQDTQAMTIETRLDANLNLQLELRTGPNSVTPISLGMIGGEFKGLMSVRDQFIPQRMEELDHLAYTLAHAVNGLHEGGVDLNGDPGQAFFTATPNAPGPAPNPPAVPLALHEKGFAKTIAVTLGDTRLVAAAASDTGIGDNRNALAISALADNLTVMDGNDSFVGYFSKITSKVGVEASRAKLSAQGMEDAMVQIKNLRDATVGVSLEQEMIDLIQFQKGFEASAKFLAVVDELMESLLNLKR